MHSSSHWKPESYDQYLGFVSHLGKGVVQWLDPKPHERILDLGCGTGDLTYEINQACRQTVGLDYSEAMIIQAKQKYEAIEFVVGDGQRFAFEQPFDAVFSNAALHWMTDPASVIESVWHSLRSGGRFVAEFGAQGNVETIIKAIYEVLPSYGLNAAELNPWYFPTIGEYSSLLERQGFQVRLAEHFARPTELADGDNGLMHWLTQFAEPFVSQLPAADKLAALRQIDSLTKQRIARGEGDTLMADYSRIRIAAYKP